MFDTGCETPVVGGRGWYITQEHQKDTMRLSGPTPGLGTQTYPIADAVTALDATDGSTLLLGVQDATYNSDLEQSEALINPFHLLELGFAIDLTPQRFGGTQEFNISNKVVALNYDESRFLMTTPCRLPTDDELNSLSIVWVDSIDLVPSSILRRKSKVVETPVLADLSNPVPDSEEAATMNVNKVPRATVDSPDWNKTLGYPSKEVLEHTMDSTTQLCAAPVKMDKRQLPKQHHKQRILPLHPCHICGRTDTDTFYSSVRSVRN